MSVNSKNNIIEYESLSDKIYKRLLYQIVNQQRIAGEKLREVKLAQEFGVSRIPIREALNRLIREGLVGTNPRRGKYVKSFTPKEVKDIYELRQNLELLALELGWHSINSKNIQNIADRLDRSDHLEGKKRYDMLLRVDENIHHLIRITSDNKILEELLEKLDFMSRPLRAFDAVELDRMENLAAERREIIEALASKDIERAKAVLKRHIQKGKESILSKLEKEQ